MILSSKWLARVLLALAAWDKQYAEEVRAGGCPHCQGPLHAAHYQRKGWGWPWGDSRSPPGGCALLRWSWCCGRHGCRRRCTPASWRFCGRRFYVAPMVLVMSAMATGVDVVPDGWDGPSRKTVRRWLGWWRSVFGASPVWIGLRADVPGLAVSRLPGGLIGGAAGLSPWRVLVGGLSLMRGWTGYVMM